MLIDTKSFKKDRPLFLGNIGAPRDHFPEDIDHVFEYLDMLKEGDYHSRDFLRMFELHRLEQYEWCPKVLMTLYNAVDFQPKSIVSFLACDEEVVGYGWHDDSFDLVAINVIGNSTWFFKDGSQQLMTPGDMLFVPEGVRHTVEGNGYRYTASICNKL